MTELINIVLEHPDFLVVDKPANVNFHDEGDLGQGFFNQCMNQYGHTLYPVHRLDKVTSGLVIMAKTLEAAQWFQLAFADKQIIKFYIAVTDQKPKKKQGTIKGDMAKARRGQWKLLKTKVSPAVTRFHTVPLTQPGSRLFLLKPETGKTHQLRVAMKSISAPILGDELYSGSNSDRVYLHATRLVFNYKDQNIDLIRLPNSGQVFLEDQLKIESVVEQLLELNWPS
ncbi:TIGR01621 family pseudouridine synthase [Psychrosphaera ytuae]|uniref:TIGR01621 family pseudouridine synthase n=1 Tax=Psychrosphaera ytuae TaxID=2820710 RepID=A0A975DD49_9GAMM|nr:TIGR01621 family pseudouridine synthase [Psychrosphaera ytuae]QTH64166.1 TIGR01621 family pseudouridine synthase [Psychrosphaera ytuae]